MMKKCRSRAGETLGEVLAGILIIALTSAALVGMINASKRLHTQTDQQETVLYDAISAVDSRADSAKSGTGTVSVQVTNSESASSTVTYDVVFYTDGGLNAYEKGAG